MLWSSAIWNTHISVLTATPSCQGSGPCVYRSTQHVFIIPALGYIIPIKISIWTYICAVRNVHSSMDIRRHHHLLPYPFYSSLWFTENTLLECTYLLMLFNQPGQENGPFLIQRSKPTQSALITHIPETLPCTWTALRTSSKLGHLMAPNPAPGSDSIISSSPAMGLQQVNYSLELIQRPLVPPGGYQRKHKGGIQKERWYSSGRGETLKLIPVSPLEFLFIYLLLQLQ